MCHQEFRSRSRDPSAPVDADGPETWSKVMGLAQGTRMHVILTNGLEFVGTMTDMTAFEIGLSSGTGHTQRWPRAQVREILVYDAGRGLANGARLARETTGGLWKTWWKAAQEPGTNEAGAGLAAVYFAFITPFVASAAFAVGSVRGERRWNSVYVSP